MEDNYCNTHCWYSGNYCPKCRLKRVEQHNTELLEACEGVMTEKIYPTEFVETSFFDEIANVRITHLWCPECMTSREYGHVSGCPVQVQFNGKLARPGQCTAFRAAEGRITDV